MPTAGDRWSSDLRRGPSHGPAPPVRRHRRRNLPQGLRQSVPRLGAAGGLDDLAEPEGEVIGVGNQESGVRERPRDAGTRSSENTARNSVLRLPPSAFPPGAAGGLWSSLPTACCLLPAAC